MQSSKSTNYDQIRSTINSTLSKTSQIPASKAQLNSYLIGQILKGEVIDLQHKDIKILLSNGQLLKGTLEDSIALSIADQADFVITDLQNSKLVLKLLTNTASNTPNATIDKALEEANLVKTERNVNVVNELLKQHMSIDKNTIQNVLRQLTTFKNASLETIVLMNKHQIPLTDTNTTQFEAYRNFEHRLLAQAKSLSSSLITNFTAEAGKPTSIPSFEAVTSILKPEQQIQQGQQTQPVQLMEQEQQLQPDQNKLSNPMLPSPGQQGDFMPAAESENPIQISIKTLLEKGLQPTDKGLLASKDNQSALENLLLKTFTMSTEQLLEPKGISQFYEKAEENLNELKQLLTQLEGSGMENKFHATSQILDNLKDNLDFMKVMNQYFGYLQLPMKLPTQYANSELFVYTNKKQLQDGNKNISVLLHLDMEHLGPIDFHLSLFQQQVTAKVSLFKEDSISLIEENLPQLQQALEAKGYSFQYQLQQMEEETNVVSTFFNENSSDIMMKRYTFDKRA